MKCKYILYGDSCKKESDQEYCPEHRIKCICGNQSTHMCCYCGQFVCGYPLCNECEGIEDTSKPSGSWGFLNHLHRKKSSVNK